LQATHAAPFAPQVARAGWKQVEPEQQPLGQLLALQPLQAPLAQLCPVGHCTQPLPPTPQAVALVPAMQLFPLQQPAQEVASQTHAPATHSCPAAQAAPLPHAQIPDAQ
jgi:hypothetical protein